MTPEAAQNQEQIQENKPSDKELNFRMMERKYQKEIEKERAARMEAERLAQEATQRRHVEEDDEEDEPYVSPKKFDKKLQKFGQTTQSEIQKHMEMAKQAAKEELKQEIWLEKNNDFYDVMQFAQKLYETDQELAETILKMPDNFERQKLVYKNIKALKLHEPAQKQPSIQEKIEANRRSPFYQPSNVGSSPYSQMGDFTPAGQKNAYEKMQELKSRLRLN